MAYQGTPETLAGTKGVDFYMVFHDIPCCSKALRRPLRAPRELIFTRYSTILHTIPRHPRDPCGHRGSRFSYGIPRYSMLFQGAPETLAGTEGVDFYMVFHDIPCYPTALQRPLQAPREFTFIWYSIIFHAIPRRSRAPCGHRGS